MNDTTRDELRGEVWSIIRGAMNTPQADNFEAESAYRDAWASEAADKVVALVTAARDAEIRELLLSEEAVEAGERVLIRDEWANANRAKSMNVSESAIIAIDLGDSDTGGQG